MTPAADALPGLARFEQRQALAAAMPQPAHLAAGPAVDPDPEYRPAHLRRTRP